MKGLQKYKHHFLLLIENSQNKRCSIELREIAQNIVNNKTETLFNDFCLIQSVYLNAGGRDIDRKLSMVF